MKTSQITKRNLNSIITSSFFKAFLLLIFFLHINCNTYSQKNPKKLGIALSGGGAKGLAHIGVLKVLEAEGIYPDIVTGTSMGSVVGGLYAIGYNSLELDSLSRALEWTQYFSDVYDRSYRTIEEKEDVERYIFSFPIKDGQILLPKGFVDGQKLSLLLSKMTYMVHGVEDFDEFDIPFRCIGTDLETGEPHIFEKGFLPDAIRSSISIPSVFEPFDVEGKLIVDGGIARNLPVQDAFDLGADIVIAVDVGAILYRREELTSIISVLDQTSSYQIVKFNQQQLNLANVVIRPDISGFSALDFTEVDSLIKVGEEAARAMLPEIHRLVGPKNKGEKIRQGITKNLPVKVPISSVEVNGLNPVETKTFKNILQIIGKRTYEYDKIDKQVNKVAATNLFNRINYQLIPERDSFILKVNANKAENTYFKVSANYHSTFNAGLLLNSTAHNFVLRGSKLSMDLRISENPALRANYLFYTKTRPNIGVKLSAITELYPGFLYLDNVLIDEYDFLHARGRMDIFSGLGRNTSIGAGLSLEYKRLDKRFFELESNNPDVEQLAVHFTFNFDNLNRKYFPTKGTQLKLSANLILGGDMEHTHSEDSRLAVANNYYNLLTYRQIFRIGPDFIIEWYNHAGVSEYRQTDFIQLFYLGRSLPYGEKFIPFTGFNYMERPVSNFAFSGLNFQLEPINNVFISGRFNYGLYRSPDFTYIDDNGYNTFLKEDGDIVGMGMEIGALSNFGPISLTSEFNMLSKDFNFLFRMGFGF